MFFSCSKIIKGHSVRLEYFVLSQAIMAKQYCKNINCIYKAYRCKVSYPQRQDHTRADYDLYLYTAIVGKWEHTFRIRIAGHSCEKVE